MRRQATGPCPATSRGRQPRRAAVSALGGAEPSAATTIIRVGRSNTQPSLSRRDNSRVTRRAGMPLRWAWVPRWPKRTGSAALVPEACNPAGGPLELAQAPCQAGHYDWLAPLGDGGPHTSDHPSARSAAKARHRPSGYERGSSSSCNRPRTGVATFPPSVLASHTRRREPVPLEVHVRHREGDHRPVVVETPPLFTRRSAPTMSSGFIRCRIAWSTVTPPPRGSRPTSRFAALATSRRAPAVGLSAFMG